jgi:flagella basal body P-ring formation protein FlgA
VVRSGRLVRLIYVRPGLRLTALGTAQDDGALGQLVRVVNADSRQQLQGTASGPDEVTVGIIGIGLSAGG